MFAILWIIESAVFLSPPILYQQPDLKCYDSNSRTYYKCTETDGGCQQSSIQIFESKYNTMTSQFQLYCDKQYIRYYALIAKFVTTPMFLPIFSWLADNYGRQKVILAAIVFQSILAILIVSVDNVYFQIVNTCLMGATLYSSSIIQVVFINESSGPATRSSIIVVLTLVYPLGSIIYTFLFGIFKDWKTTSFLVITLPSIFILSSFLFLQETPLYLFYRQKQQQLIQVITKIASIDSKQYLIDSKSYQFKFQYSETQQNSYIDIIRSTKLTRFIIICISIQVANQLYYNGVNFCLQDIGLDIYQNTIIIQSCQIASQIFLILQVSKFRRKTTIQIVLFCGFLFNFMQIFDQLVDKGSILERQRKYIQIVLASIVKFVGSIGQTILYIYYSEVYPTGIKSQTSGLIVATGLMSVSFVPIVVDYARYQDQSPLVIISFIALLGFLITFFLVETLNRPVIHTIEQFENSVNKQYEQSISLLHNNK